MWRTLIVSCIAATLLLCGVRAFVGCGITSWFRIVGHSMEVNSVAIGPDRGTILGPGSRNVVSGSQDCTVLVWDFSAGKVVKYLDAEAQAGPLLSVHSVAITHDGRTIVSGHEIGNPFDRTGAIAVWRLSTGVLVRTIGDIGVMRVWCVAISPDDRTVVSGSPDDTIRVWNLSTGALVRTLPVAGSGDTGHGGNVYSVAISPDGGTLVSGGGDTTVRVWSLSTGRLVRTLPVAGDAGHMNAVRSVAISPYGATVVASGGDDGTIKVWRLSDGALLHTLAGHANGVRSVAITADGGTLVSGGGDNAVKMWDLATGAPVRTLPVPGRGDAGHTGGVRSVAISPDGGTVASGSADKTIKLWNLSTGALVRTLGRTDVRPF